MSKMLGALVGAAIYQRDCDNDPLDGRQAGEGRLSGRAELHPGRSHEPN